jgi:hypothetical protein
MIRQYSAQRRLGGCNPHGIGTVAVGTIVYLQDCRNLRDAVCRNPWIVEAWHNREYSRGCAGEPRFTYLRGGHLATVRSLRDGRVKRVADHLILACVDADLTKAA